MRFTHLKFFFVLVLILSTFNCALCEGEVNRESLTGNKPDRSDSTGIFYSPASVKLRELDGNPNPFFTIQVGSLYALINTNSKVKFNSNQSVGTEINLQNDLGLKNKGFYPRADLFFRLGKRHQIVASFFSTFKSATRTLDRSITFGDSVFAVNTSVTGKYQFYVYGIDYRFSIIRRPQWEVGLLLGGKFFDVHTSLRANLNGSSYTVSKNVYAPVVLPGVHASYTLGKHFVFRAFAEYFLLRLNDWNFNIIEVRPTAEFYPIENVGIGLGYQYFATRIQKDPVGDFDGEFKYSFNSVSLFLCARF